MSCLTFQSQGTGYSNSLRGRQRRFLARRSEDEAARVLSKPEKRCLAETSEASRGSSRCGSFEGLSEPWLDATSKQLV